MNARANGGAAPGREPASGGTGAGGALFRYAPSQFVEPALSLMSLPILTRVLGAENYGILSVLLLTGALIRNVGFDWLGDSAMRFRSVYRDDQDRLYSNLVAGLLLSVLVLGALLAPLRGLGVSGSMGAVAAYLWWVFADSAVSGFNRCGEMLLRATHRPLGFGLNRAGQGVVRHVVAVAGLLLIAESLSVYWGLRILGLAVVGVWSWIAVGALGHVKWRRMSWATQREFLRFSLPLAASLLSGSLRVEANRYVVMWLAGPQATGLYAGAATIGGAPLFICQQLVMLGLYPLAIDAFDRGASTVPILRDGIRYYVLAGIPALVGMTILARPILSVMAGPEFVDGAPVLSTLAGAMFIYGLSQYFSLQFMVARRTGIMAVIALASGILNVGLCSLLVAAYGYRAAAVATVIANLVLLACNIAWGLTPWRQCIPWQSLTRSLVASLVMAAGVWGLGRLLALPELQRLVLQVTAGSLLYGLILWGSGEFTGELATVRGRLRARRQGDR